MRYMRGVILIAALFSTASLYALNANRIVAWPVPFNPSTKILTIDYAPGVTPDTLDRVKIEIFDINGDRVFEGEYGGLPVNWSGRNMSGRTVSPGMYIIRVTVENMAQGTLGRRVIRIVVVR